MHQAKSVFRRSSFHTLPTVNIVWRRPPPPSDLAPQETSKLASNPTENDFWSPSAHYNRRASLFVERRGAQNCVDRSSSRCGETKSEGRRAWLRYVIYLSLRPCETRVSYTRLATAPALKREEARVAHHVDDIDLHSRALLEVTVGVDFSHRYPPNVIL